MKRTALRDLADRLGILPEYVEQTGRYVRRTSDRTREALLSGRAHVSVEDVKALVHATFRHRILVNYRAEAEGVTVEKVIDRLLETVKEPKG